MKYKIKDLEKIAKILKVKHTILGNVEEYFDDEFPLSWKNNTFPLFKEFLPDLSRYEFFQLSMKYDTKHDQLSDPIWYWKNMETEE
jgi:hypothetical protein